ncbi:MAG: class I SAM-dependent methyltransferase [Conexivisphaerales archaeon]
MSKGDVGLGEDWQKLIKDFEILSEYYDEGNKILSFGNDIKFRTELLDQGLPASGVFLDIGCGPGTMSVIARDLRPSMEGVLLDPVPKMLSKAVSNLYGEKYHFVCGIYEYLPFRDEAFSSCMAGFTIRDARNRLAAFDEIRRVLRKGSNFLFIDLAKPDSALKRFLVSTYWKYIAPARLRIAMGERGKPYEDIYVTYKHLPSNSVIIREMHEKIGRADYRTKMFDGVLMAIVTKM